MLRKFDKMNNTETAILAAGCFWGVEKAYQSLPGVITTMVGYTGGKSAGPTYKNVCSGSTGHAEAILIEFDPQKINYKQILDLFWKIHDPTTFNRQGPDIGSQYRSAIFFLTNEQFEIARQSVKEVQPRFKFPIVTQLAPADEFYPAEEYHQSYLRKKGR